MQTEHTTLGLYNRAKQRRRITLHYPIRKRSIFYPNVSLSECFGDLPNGHSHWFITE
jgi:hypothetical protein